MAKIEHADAKGLDLPHRVTLFGKTTEHADFDAKKFARAIVRNRKPKVTTADREARLRRAEEKLAKY
ncbi:hypothetical protein [Bosea sp. NPDC055594]